MNKINFNKLSDGSYEAMFIEETGYGTELHEGSVLNITKEMLDIEEASGTLKRHHIEIRNNGGVNNFYIINDRLSILHIKDDLSIIVDTYIKGQCVGEILRKYRKTVNLKDAGNGRVIPNISMKNVTHKTIKKVGDKEVESIKTDKYYNVPYKIALEQLLEGKTGDFSIIDKEVHHIEANWNNMFQFTKVVSEDSHKKIHRLIGQSRHDLSVVIKELGQLQAFIDYMSK